METLEKLIDEREKIRNKEKILTEKIKNERAKASEKKRQTSVTKDEYHRVVEENRKLRSLFVVLARANGATYREIGDMIGCGAQRASMLVTMGIRMLRIESTNLQTDE